MSSILNLLVNLLIGIGSIFIALAVYKLSRQKLRELWLENFGEIHTTFWNDNDIREIRYCITYDEAYEPLKAVLLHRRSIYENVDENQKTSAMFQIRSIPTMLIFDGGKLQNTLVGALPKQQIIQAMAQFL